MIPVSKMQPADESLALDTPGWFFLIYYCSQWAQQRSSANSLMTQAQKWRKWKSLLCFTIISLCKKSHVAGRPLVYSCANKNQEPSVPPRANGLSELGPTSSGQGTVSSWCIQTWISPLYQGQKNTQFSKNYQLPHTYFSLVCFLLSFFPNLLSSISHGWDCWKRGNLFLLHTGCGLSLCLSSTLPPLQYPFKSFLLFLTSVL